MTDDKVVDLDDARKAKALPDPVGFRILIAIPEKDEKTDGGVLLPEDTRKREEAASIVGMVLKMGPDAYADAERFPNGPWCKEGDFIVMRSYSGTRLDIHGQEFRIINDDSVEAVVEDPRGIKRA
uniref:Co-chaperonin GroES n=1 Tax=uncultured virus TaxID=340016 RepID=A0A221S4M6_9VIRU|nr:co-chaperonin GroES [uncultured virus]